MPIDRSTKTRTLSGCKTTGCPPRGWDRTRGGNSLSANYQLQLPTLPRLLRFISDNELRMGHRPIHPITDRKVLEHVSRGIRKHQDDRNMHTGPGPLEIQARPGLAP